jgi:hypothetical protein
MSVFPRLLLFSRIFKSTTNNALQKIVSKWLYFLQKYRLFLDLLCIFGRFLGAGVQKHERKYRKKLDQPWYFLGPRGTNQPRQGPKNNLQGALQKKATDPDVVGWFLGGQKSTRVGQFFLDFFLVVFLFPLQRNAQKRD